MEETKERASRVENILRKALVQSSGLKSIHLVSSFQVVLLSQKHREIEEEMGKGTGVRATLKKDE